MIFPKIIYIMGAPGSGKGTQAQFLADELDYYQFSTGAVFRFMTQQDTPLGRAVKERVDNGRLCEPELAAEVVMSAITEHLGKGQGIVFDGTPRTVRESEIIDQFFKEFEYGDPLVFYLNIDKEIMMARNAKRRYCLQVHPDFPVITPEDEQRCLDLGGQVGARVDDSPDKFVTRWQQFMDNTYPVIEKYRARNMLHEIDGKHSIADVHTSVMKVIDTLRHGEA
jgi:adenylate kinase